VCRPRVSDTCPAARALCTHPTGPYGATSQRRPSCSTIVTGVRRGRPLLRPTVVSRYVAGTTPARAAAAISRLASRPAAPGRRYSRAMEPL
jgi:hypothetical protein